MRVFSDVVIYLPLLCGRRITLCGVSFPTHNGSRTGTPPKVLQTFPTKILGRLPCSCRHSVSAGFTELQRFVERHYLLMTRIETCILLFNVVVCPIIFVNNMRHEMKSEASLQYLVVMLEARLTNRKIPIHRPLSGGAHQSFARPVKPRSCQSLVDLNIVIHGLLIVVLRRVRSHRSYNLCRRTRTHPAKTRRNWNSAQHRPYTAFQPSHLTPTLYHRIQ